jgi:hypothetical protein
MELVWSKWWEMQASDRLSNRELFDKIFFYSISALNIVFYVARIYIIFYSRMFRPLHHP